MAIQLGTNWNLRGAANHKQLNAIVNDLHDFGDGYSATAKRLGVAREVVAEVGRWYQSLWMRA